MSSDTRTLPGFMTSAEKTRARTVTYVTAAEFTELCVTCPDDTGALLASVFSRAAGPQYRTAPAPGRARERRSAARLRALRALPERT